MTTVAGRTPTGREMALVAAGQGATMLSGALLALLIAHRFGRDLKTDAFFAAYGVYALGVTFTQSFRLTAVPRLIGPVAGNIEENATRMLGAATVMALALVVPLALAAAPLADVLVEVDPGDVGRDTLRILAVAMACQLFASMLATILMVRGAFAAVALTTLAVAAITVGVFLVSEPAIGILAAPTGLAAAAFWLCLVFGTLLVRTGWRPRALPRLLTIVQEAGRLALASATFVGATGTYVVCVAVAAREGPGEATLFVYAYVASGILLGLTANVTSVVRSPAITASRQRTAEAAAAGLWSFRFTIVLAAPVLAMAVLVGKPVIGFVLGADFQGAAAASMVVTMIALAGWLLGTAAGMFAIIELLARDDLPRLAFLVIAQIAAVAAAAPVGAALAGVEGIAAALSLVTLVVTGVLLRWAFQERWREVATDLARAAGRGLVVVGVAFAPSIVLLAVIGRDTVAAVVAAGLLATVLVAVSTSVAWPYERRMLVALVQRSG